ncbi:FAD-dependent oxidoreductase [Streptomyces sp. NPDC020875]|uniref:NAD(P)/FAD-dependent oxidoreductase n=1 Tax=Streptomyces sp. NPDC020875 TaxID=3154898 RepID=UPI0033E872BA
MPETTGVAVVGAGVIGTLIARELVAADPGAAVTVLDRELVAGGASRRSAGLHFPRGASAAVRAMAAESQRYWAGLAAARPGLPLRSLPMTVIADRASEPGLREAYLPEAGLREIPLPDGGLPPGPVTVPAGAAAWTGDGCQYADVAAVTQTLAAELRPRVRFLEGVAVTGVTTGPDGVRLALGTGGILRAARAVLAPGPWIAHPAWRERLAPLGIRVKKIVALHIESVPAADDGAVVFHDEDAFLLPYRDRGHWLFSYTCQEWDVDPDTVESGPTAAHLAQAAGVLRRYAPGLAGRAGSGRVFCDAYNPAGGPLVRPLTDDGRLVFAGAAGGSGYRLAPAIAGETVRLLAKDGPGLRDPSLRRNTT